MNKIIINNKANLLISVAFKNVGDAMDRFDGESQLYPKYHEFNIGNLQYTIIAKRGKVSGSIIYTIEYTGYDHEV